jgi:hypothetical protein
VSLVVAGHEPMLTTTKHRRKIDDNFTANFQQILVKFCLPGLSYLPCPVSVKKYVDPEYPLISLYRISGP